MVVSDGPDGQRIFFKVKGNPPVQQKRPRMNGKTSSSTYHYDPSSKTKQEFARMASDKTKACGQTTFPYFADTMAILLNAKFVLPRPKEDFIRNKTPLKLSANAASCPRGKDINNLQNFMMDALSGILYRNETKMLKGEVEKCYATNISEAVDWMELEFTKVVCCIDPPCKPPQYCT